MVSVAEKMRAPFFVAAVVAMGLVVLAELGSRLYVGPAGPELRQLPTPGLGIPYMALLDGLVLLSVGLIGAAMLIPDRIHGNVQGIVTFVLSLVVLVLAIPLIFTAISLLVLMVSLLLAIPFGTMVYLATYAPFNVGAAEATISGIMTLKIAFAALLVLAHQRFLENIGLMLLVLTSLLANVIVAFLQAFPGFLVSITDDVGAIVIAVLAVIWSIVLLIGSIPAMIKALRLAGAAR